jgi:hypothetical protein
MRQNVWRPKAFNSEKIDILKPFDLTTYQTGISSFRSLEAMQAQTQGIWSILMNGRLMKSAHLGRVNRTCTAPWTVQCSF